MIEHFLIRRILKITVGLFLVFPLHSEAEVLWRNGQLNLGLTKTWWVWRLECCSWRTKTILSYHESLWKQPFTLNLWTQSNFLLWLFACLLTWFWHRVVVAAADVAQTAFKLMILLLQPLKHKSACVHQHV